MNRLWWGLICVGVLAGSTGCRTCNGDRYRLTNRDHCDPPPARPASTSRDDLGQLNRMRTAADSPACVTPTTALQPTQPQPNYPSIGYPTGFPSGGSYNGPIYGTPGGFAPSPIRPGNELPPPGSFPMDTIPPPLVPATPSPAIPGSTYRPQFPAPLPLATFPK